MRESADRFALNLQEEGSQSGGGRRRREGRGRDTEGSDEFVLIRKEVLSQMDSEALPGAQRQVA